MISRVLRIALATPSASFQLAVFSVQCSEEAEEAPSSGLSVGVGNSTCRRSENGSPGAGEKGQGEYVSDNRVEHGERAGWLAPIELREECSVGSVQRTTKKVIRRSLETKRGRSRQVVKSCPAGRAY